jgi:voltage-gated potassium channel
MHPDPQPIESQATFSRNLPPRGAFHHATAKLLGALGILFVTDPFIQDLPNGDLLEAVLLSLVMVFAVLAVGGRRRSMIVAVILLIPTLASKWLNHLHPDLLHPAVFLIFAVLFFGFVVARLLLFIIRAPRVDTNALCAGVAGFLLLGLVWTTAYLAVARLNPAAFALPTALGAPAVLDPFSALYFSFITLCTVGYGDIAPVSKVARMLALVEAITGLFYMAVLISRLVSMHSSGSAAAGAHTTGKSSP